MPAETFFKEEILTQDKLKSPRMYKVILHNDDYTTMDFVVEILMVIFHKSAEDATRIMLDVHKKGRGIVGVYTYDIALTKTTLVNQIAKEREYPLKTSMEEA
jgi:ATP-dependent Clp protease adaptor protein ClpS